MESLKESKHWILWCFLIKGLFERGIMLKTGREGVCWVGLLLLLLEFFCVFFFFVLEGTDS